MIFIPYDWWYANLLIIVYDYESPSMSWFGEEELLATERTLEWFGKDDKE